MYLIPCIADLPALIVVAMFECGMLTEQIGKPGLGRAPDTTC